MIELHEERADDWWEVEALLDTCFAPGREALSSYRLRDGVPPVAPLCLLARDSDGTLAGAVRNWPVQIAGEPGGAMGATGRKWAILLGPVAVHPTRQGEGLGAALVGASVERARGLGWSRVMLVGDAPYYGRFGFARLDGVTMPPPTNPDRVLGRALRPGAWDGVGGQVIRAVD